MRARTVLPQQKVTRVFCGEKKSNFGAGIAGLGSTCTDRRYNVLITGMSLQVGSARAKSYLIRFVVKYLPNNPSSLHNPLVYASRCHQ